MVVNLWSGPKAACRSKNMPTTETVKVPVSPLVLADRLISLAQEADRAGYSDAAVWMLGLAYAVFDEQPSRRN